MGWGGGGSEGRAALRACVDADTGEMQQPYGPSSGNREVDEIATRENMGRGRWSIRNTGFRWGAERARRKTTRAGKEADRGC